MKRCPECETRYEDHVTTCLVDGSSLETAVTITPPPALEVRPPPPAPKSGGGMWRSFAFLLLGLLIAASLFWMFATGPSTPDVVVAAPQPDPQPDTKTEPKPEPEPELEPETFTVQLATSPAGATVTQDDRTVCVTPCNIQLVDESALPTTYRVSLSGHRTESYTVTETGHHNVRLIPNAARPSRPGPRPQRPRPDPVPDPEPVAPDPVPENPATEPKPDPKPDIEVLEEVRDPFK